MRNTSKQPLDFIGYIQKLPVTETGVGMFIADAKADLNLVNARNWEQLEEYLDACFLRVRDDVYTSARKVWRRYRSIYPAYLEPEF